MNDSAETISSVTPSAVTLDSTSPAGANARLKLAAVEPLSSNSLIITSAKSSLSARGSSET